ncbi:MAG: MBL fold metallo-hydrolase [Candidatus Absconditabacteria bacterium]
MTKSPSAKKSISNIKSITVKPLGGVGDHLNSDLSGSCTLVEIQRTTGKIIRILVDCGRQQMGDNNLQSMGINPLDLDCVVVTHAHADHVALLPLLVKDGLEFNGKILMTNTTYALSKIMLMDAVDVMTAEFNRISSHGSNRHMKQSSKLEQLNHLKKKLELIGINKKNKKHMKTTKSKREPLSKNQKQEVLFLQEQIKEAEVYLRRKNALNEELIQKNLEEKLENAGIQMLYDYKDVTNVLNRKNTECLDYNTYYDLGDGVRLCFINAGHVLGSAQCLVQVDTGMGEYVNLGFSGDFGRFDGTSNVGMPDIFQEKLDFYMIESTYGGRYHTNRDEEMKFLANLINSVAKRKGRVFIPTFMLQRFQDVAANLIKMQLSNDPKIDSLKHLKSVQFYYGGVKLDQINGIYYQMGDNDIYKNLHSSGRLVNSKVRDVNSPLNKLGSDTPAVVFGTGGMLEGGTIQKHVEEFAFGKNALVFVGYQGVGTKGREVVEGARDLIIPGKGWVHIGCEVHQMKSFSTHGDQNDILKLINETEFKSDGTIMFNHGIYNYSQRYALEGVKRSTNIPYGVDLVQAEIGKSVEILKNK